MKIYDHMLSYRGTPEERERSLGLFLRGSLLARIMGISEIYEQIVDKPGTILDIGTWRGQTAVVCENLRAIFEPLSFNRRIVCFDTFEGYQGFGEKDAPTSIHRDGTYSLGGGYPEFLNELLVLHETCNAMGANNNGKHKVIQGDCRETIPEFFKSNPNEFISLAFFDVNSFQPTKEAFNEVWERLIPGGVIAFWQLTRNIIPAEGRVYSEEILGKFGHSIRRTRTYPGLCYLTRT